MLNIDARNKDAVTLFTAPGNINDDIPTMFSSPEEIERHLEYLSLSLKDQRSRSKLHYRRGKNKILRSIFSVVRHGLALLRRLHK